MEDVLQLNSELEVFDSNKLNASPKYSILISHDNSVGDINCKFKFAFFDANNQKIDSIKVGSWTFVRISVFRYYGRAKVSITIKDPNGITLPGIESGGNTLDLDEKYNLKWVKETLIELIKRLRILSCFQNYRSKLDFNNLLNSNSELIEFIKRI